MPQDTPLSEVEAFRELMRRVRDRDPAAWDELFQRYEPELRRAVRVRLAEQRLRCLLDSADICQSILANFYVCAAAGRYEVDSPEQLLQLLLKMAHNRLTDKLRKYQLEFEHRDPRGTPLLDGLPARSGRPVDLDNQVHALLQRLSPQERDLAEQRLAGRSWDALATERAISPEALRKRHARAIDQAAAELGL